MYRSIKILLPLIFSLGLIAGCNSTNSDSSEPTLEDIIPNSNWYYTDPDNSDIYNRLVFGDLNTLVAFFGGYTYPCGSGQSTDSYQADYEILSDSEILFSFDEGSQTEINEVVSYSDEKLVVELSNSETNAIVLYKNCEDTN